MFIFWQQWLSWKESPLLSFRYAEDIQIGIPVLKTYKWKILC